LLIYAGHIVQNMPTAYC